MTRLGPVSAQPHDQVDEDRDTGQSAVGRRASRGRARPVPVVLLVGPDGTGKSSLARLLVEGAAGPVRHEHYRPYAPVESATPTPPHRRGSRSVPVSAAKVVVRWLEQLWAARVARHAKRPALVVVERGFWDQVVDPARYRMAPAVRGLTVLLGRLLPKADLAVLLAGDPALVHSRKPELTTTEIERQIATWRRLLPDVGRSGLELDVAAPLDELLVRTARALERC